MAPQLSNPLKIFVAGSRAAALQYLMGKVNSRELRGNPPFSLLLISIVWETVADGYNAELQFAQPVAHVFDVGDFSIIDVEEDSADEPISIEPKT